MAERSGRFIKGEYRKYSELEHSVDFAWMLGVLSAGGTIKDTGEIGISNKSNELITTFCQRGESVFGIKSHFKAYDSRYRNGVEIRIRQYIGTFYNKGLVAELSDFKTYAWTEEFSADGKLSWIYNDRNYLKSFLSGYFDVKGNIETRNDDGRIVKVIFLGTINTNVCRLLRDILDNFEIKSVPKGSYRKGRDDEVSGVYIIKTDSVFLFSQNVKSVIPKKSMELTNCKRYSWQTNELVSRYCSLFEEAVPETALKLLIRFSGVKRFKRFERDEVVRLVAEGVYAISHMTAKLKNGGGRDSQVLSKLIANIENAKELDELRENIRNTERFYSLRV